MSAPPVFEAPLGRWGGGPPRAGRLALPRDLAELAALLAARPGPLVPRGAGRAYSDAALPAPGGVAAGTGRLDRLVAWEGEALVAEAGVRLGDLAAAALRRGRFPAVLPGTGAVTVGGAVAADVHGKTHAAAGGRGGSFAAHLDWVELMGPSGAVRRLWPGEPLFEATCGGMGLTGVVTAAAVRTVPAETGWMRVETRAVRGLPALMAAVAEAPGPYVVAWLDGLGAELRGLVSSADHALAAELGPRERADPRAERSARAVEVPAALGRLPGGLMAGRAAALALRLANGVVWRRGGARGLVPWREVLHPLDGLGRWDRLYGRPGLVQVQLAWPEAQAETAVAEALAEVRAGGRGPFLAVLKRLGPGRGGLSFPLEGWTLALDFPAAPWGRALAARLTAGAAARGGRVYLAKDAGLDRAGFTTLEPRAAGFRALRAEGFGSALSARLGL